eukprot:408302-Rhodomonas_salina.1
MWAGTRCAHRASHSHGHGHGHGHGHAAHEHVVACETGGPHVVKCGASGSGSGEEECVAGQRTLYHEICHRCEALLKRATGPLLFLSPSLLHFRFFVPHGAVGGCGWVWVVARRERVPGGGTEESAGHGDRAREAGSLPQHPSRPPP